MRDVALLYTLEFGTKKSTELFPAVAGDDEAFRFPVGSKTTFKDQVELVDARIVRRSPSQILHRQSMPRILRQP